MAKVFIDAKCTFSSNCSIRNSTYHHLRTIHRSEAERLSDRMRRSLLRDELSRISPILPEVYLKALDRRLGKVLEKVEECISQYGSENVLFDRLKLPLRRGWIWLLISWEPEGYYDYSTMSYWEPEGRYSRTKLWRERPGHRWSALTPFWFSAVELLCLLACSLYIILFLS